MYDFLDWFAQDWQHVVVMILLLGFIYAVYHKTSDIISDMHYHHTRSKSIRDLGYPPKHCDADGDPVTREYLNN